ncbi:MAG: hypothetical protein QW051_00095 [Candidatus Aenigmatarchaeota archaeon]
MLNKILFTCLAIFLLMNILVLASAEVTEEEAQIEIEKAEYIIKEMQSLGFGVMYANDTLNEAKILFNQGRYLAAKELAKKVEEIKEKAIKVNEMIDLVEERLYDMSSNGYDVSEAYKLFYSGLEEFKNDNYIDAEEIMNEVINMLDEIEAEQIIKTKSSDNFENILVLIFDNLWVVILFAILLLLIVGKTKNILDHKKRIKKISELEKEMEATKEKIKEMQKKYFEIGEISKIDYEVAMDKLNKKLTDVQKELSLLDSKKH